MYCLGMSLDLKRTSAHLDLVLKEHLASRQIWQPVIFTHPNKSTKCLIHSNVKRKICNLSFKQPNKGLVTWDQSLLFSSGVFT